MLATRVRFAMDAEDRKVLMVTESRKMRENPRLPQISRWRWPEEGKSVFLADCDFRKPAQYKIFDFHCPKGCDFCTAISQHQKVRVIRQRQVPGLSVASGSRRQVRS